MNIGLFLSKGAGLGLWNNIGTLQRELSYYKNLAEDGNIVHIFSYKKDFKGEIHSNIIVHIVPLQFIPDRLVFLRQITIPLYFLLIGIKLDYIITNQAHSGGLIAAIASKIWGCKLLARCGYVYGKQKEIAKTNSLKATLRSFYEKCTFRLSTWCLIPTEDLCDWVTINYNITKSKIILFPNFVDLDLFKKYDTKRDIDILYVGRLEPVKRLNLILQASVNKKFKILFIGAGSLEDELLSFANNNNIDLNIIRKVENTELPKYYCRSKVFTLVSTWEGHPKSLIEAMACGCLPIGSNVPGINNIIRQSELLINNHFDLESRLSDVLNNYDKYSDQKLALLEFVTANYDFKLLYQKLKRILNA